MTGTREIAEFLGDRPPRALGFAHIPASTDRLGVVICAPLYAEFIRNYRREVDIARGLASRGVAVQRFHYRGQGNGEGDDTITSYETMEEDALAAAQRLVDLSGVGRLAFFGTRFGALVAAATARHFEGSPVVLWDPVTDGHEYFRGLLRALHIRGLKHGSDPLLSSGDPVGRVASDSSIDILGYTITGSLLETGGRRALAEEFPLSPRKVLVVRFGKNARQDRKLDELVDAWHTAGHHVDDRSVGRPEPWWFSAGPLVRLEILNEATSLTIDWLATATNTEPIGNA
jgi:hypothetical protein